MRPLARGPGLSLAAVSAGVFLAALDQTMVVTILPSILRDLRIPVTRLDDAAWIITGYLLGYTVAMPLFGRIADVRGRRLLYLISLAIFGVGSVLCVLAPDLRTLVAARVVQAAGGGALVPIAMAVAAYLYPPQRLAFSLGVIGASAEAGGVLGPLYGAALAEVLGWRGVFLANVPLGLLLAWTIWRLVPGHTGEDEAHTRVDWVGAAILAVSLTGLAVGLAGNTETGSAAVRPVWLVLAAAAFGAFLFHQSGRAQALVNLRLFRSAAFSAANLANFAVGVALIVGMVEVPLYAYSLLGMSQIEGGLLLIRMTVMIPVGALIGGYLADRLGYRPVAAAGFLVTALGYLLISRWPAHPGNAVMTRDLLITGFGFGLVIPPIGATVIRAAGAAWMATGSALVTVSRMVGMMVGLAALSSWGIRRFNGLMADEPLPLRAEGMREPEYQALVAAYDETVAAALRAVYSEFFLVAALVALAGIAATLWFGRRAAR